MKKRVCLLGKNLIFGQLYKQELHEKLSTKELDKIRILQKESAKDHAKITLGIDKITDAFRMSLEVLALRQLKSFEDVNISSQQAMRILNCSLQKLRGLEKYGLLRRRGQKGELERYCIVEIYWLRKYEIWDVYLTKRTARALLEKREYELWF